MINCLTFFSFYRTILPKRCFFKNKINAEIIENIENKEPTKTINDVLREKYAQLGTMRYCLV